MRYATRLVGDVEAARDPGAGLLSQIVQAGPATDRRTPETVAVHGVPPQLCRLPAQRGTGHANRWTDAGGVRGQCPDAASADLEQADRNAFSQSQIDCLPERDQEVIRLKFQDGLSYKAIAEITACRCRMSAWYSTTLSSDCARP